MTTGKKGVLFKIEGLKHRYDGQLVLDIPYLNLNSGRIYAFVGPNGSGKTTLLAILNLLVQPTEGEISYMGQAVGPDESSRRTKRLDMSMLLQEPYLFNTTVAKNVAWGLEARGVPNNEIGLRIDEALETVGLNNFKSRRARLLSGGESQKVALARALATCPKVLFLDEPIANVDHQSALALETVVRRINRESGMTVIMTTHNLNQAYRMAHEVFTMFQGNMISSPMDNLFAGRVLEKHGRFVFKSAKAEFESPYAESSEKVTHALVHPEDIIVSKEPFESSARNVLAGKIKGIGERGKAVRLTITAGENFTVVITRESYKEMSLELGSEVCLTFKASSVRLF